MLTYNTKSKVFLSFRKYKPGGTYMMQNIQKHILFSQIFKFIESALKIPMSQNVKPSMLIPIYMYYKWGGNAHFFIVILAKYKRYSCNIFYNNGHMKVKPSKCTFYAENRD